LSEDALEAVAGGKGASSSKVPFEKKGFRRRDANLVTDIMVDDIGDKEMGEDRAS